MQLCVGAGSELSPGGEWGRAGHVLAAAGQGTAGHGAAGDAVLAASAGTAILQGTGRTGQGFAQRLPEGAASRAGAGLWVLGAAPRGPTGWQCVAVAVRVVQGSSGAGEGSSGSWARVDGCARSIPARAAPSPHRCGLAHQQNTFHYSHLPGK